MPIDSRVRDGSSGFASSGELFEHLSLDGGELVGRLGRVGKEFDDVLLVDLRAFDVEPLGVADFAGAELITQALHSRAIHIDDRLGRDDDKFVIGPFQKVGGAGNVNSSSLTPSCRVLSSPDFRTFAAMARPPVPRPPWDGCTFENSVDVGLMRPRRPGSTESAPGQARLLCPQPARRFFGSRFCFFGSGLCCGRFFGSRFLSIEVLLPSKHTQGKAAEQRGGFSPSHLNSPHRPPGMQAVRCTAPANKLFATVPMLVCRMPTSMSRAARTKAAKYNFDSFRTPHLSDPHPASPWRKRGRSQKLFSVRTQAYTSKFRTSSACFSMNSRRGSTLSPMRMRKSSSAPPASCMVT